MRACLGGVGVLLASWPVVRVVCCSDAPISLFYLKTKTFNKAGVSALVITQVKNIWKIRHEVCSRLDRLGG